MSDTQCARLEFLLQADIDGQLDIGETAGLTAHLVTCAGCRERRSALMALSVRLRTEVPYHAAPAGLRRSIEAKLRVPAQRRVRDWWHFAFPAGAAAAFAAALLVAMLPRPGETLAQSVVASHIRALQPGHMMDVVSTDRHTVKPWFDGRLDYAPPVKDLAAQGFSLAGGRLDYLAGRRVAALDYRRLKHDIDFYVWPSADTMSKSPVSGVVNGYNFISWSQDNMKFWVVSDLNAAELAEFATLWRDAK